jgi:hypothetical protein
LARPRQDAAEVAWPGEGVFAVLDGFVGHTLAGECDAEFDSDDIGIAW